MKKIVLYGHLRDKFGPEFLMDVASPAEAIRALEANFGGRFFKALKDGQYRVGFSEDDAGLPEEVIAMGTGQKEIHIEPVLAGAGGRNGGIILTVIGIALIVVAIVFAPPVGAAGAAGISGAGAGGGAAAAGGLGASAFTVAGASISYGQIALIGASLALSGVSSILTPVPKLGSGAISNRERPEERPSFFFNGPVNSSEQGGWAPVIFGRFRTGSVVVSGDVKVQKI